MISRTMEDGIEYVKIEAIEYRSLLEKLKMLEEWQPIETAPVDKEIIVGFYDYDHDWIQYLVVWDVEGFVDSKAGEKIEQLGDRITHWHELPSLPDPLEETI